MRDDKRIRSSNAAEKQPRTPANNPSCASGHAKVATTTKARRRTVYSSAKRKKRSSADWESQQTLTQIGFVTNPLIPSWNDKELDYITANNEPSNLGGRTEVIDPEETPHGGCASTRSSRPRARTVDKLKHQDDDSQDDDDPDFQVRKKNRRTRNTSFRSNASAGMDKNVKSSNGKTTSLRRLKARGAGRHENNTLTQMDFVRPFAIMDSDDEKLGYIGPSARQPSQSEITGKDGTYMKSEAGCEGSENQGSLNRRKRRRLYHKADLPNRRAVVQSDKLLAQMQSPREPITPQKPRKFVIPSSQSPESPDCVIISPSKFRDIPRCAIQSLSGKASEQATKPDIQSPNFIKQISRSPLHFSSQSGATAPKSPVVAPVVASLRITSQTDSPLKVALDASPEPSKNESTLGEPANHLTLLSCSERPATPEAADSPLKLSKLVVLDTDAETDYDDSEDILPRNYPTRGQSQQGPDDDENHDTVNDDNLSDSSSCILPPVPNSGTDLETSDLHSSDFTLASDASIHYRRPLPSQFPTGPIPTLSTQKMAELFPQDTSSPPGFDLPAPSLKNLASQLSPHETETQTTNQSQAPLKLSTSVIPGSPSLVEPAETTRTRARESVILVESSQLVDKIQKRNSFDEENRRGNIFCASQWLTDSVMESIPPPPLWMPSEDSGELDLPPHG
jgi:hypothetical protein